MISSSSRPKPNRAFREVIAEPLFFIFVIPFIVLYGMLIMRQELATEWRRLCEEVYGDEFTSHWHALWRQFKEQIGEWKYRLIAGAKPTLSGRQSDPKERPFVATNEKSFHVEAGTPSRSEKSIVSAAAPMEPKRHAIFPGTAAARNGNVPPKPWDESQWID